MHCHCRHKQNKYAGHKNVTNSVVGSEKVLRSSPTFLTKSVRLIYTYNYLGGYNVINELLRVQRMGNDDVWYCEHVLRTMQSELIEQAYLDLEQCERRMEENGQ